MDRTLAYTPFVRAGVPRGGDLCWRTLPLVLLIAAVAYRLAGQYDIHRLRRLREEFLSVAKGTLLLFLILTF